MSAWRRELHEEIPVSSAMSWSQHSRRVRTISTKDIHRRIRGKPVGRPPATTTTTTYTLLLLLFIVLSAPKQGFSIKPGSSMALLCCGIQEYCPLPWKCNPVTGCCWKMRLEISLCKEWEWVKYEYCRQTESVFRIDTFWDWSFFGMRLFLIESVWNWDSLGLRLFGIETFWKWDFLELRLWDWHFWNWDF